MHTHKTLLSTLLLAVGGLLFSSLGQAANLATAPVTSDGGAGEAVSLNAVVEAVRQTTLSAQVPGAIVALHVKVGDAVKPLLPLGGGGKHIAQAPQELAAVAFTAFGHREPLVCRLRVSYKRFAAQKGMQIVNRALWRGLCCH